MKYFRTEIRNSPKRQTIKVYVHDIKCDVECKELLEQLCGVDFVEIQESLSRDRVKENVTVFVKDDADVNRVQQLVENKLDEHFAFD
ncbi:hypothetical protein [Ochrovirga pacifica]|uniref:hypothetical protein n=1 Tax=Ochrovirga pacifica TaxID=1042376 RepID=UPI00025591C5|nr:hypothetical protein [Ochrovirga pacifica]